MNQLFNTTKILTNLRCKYTKILTNNQMLVTFPQFMLQNYYIPHIVSYKPGTVEVATIWTAVAKSMTACPTIMGTGLRFL